MQEFNNPLPQQTVQNPPTSAMPTSQQNKSNNSFMLSLLSIMLLLATSAAFFFVFQFNKAKSLLGDAMKQQVVATAIPLASAVPEDETSSWTTYTDTKKNLSFKHPTSYVIKNSEELSSTNYFINVYSDTDLTKLAISFRFDESRSSALADHGEIATESPAEYPEMSTSTGRYKVTKYTFGEGTPGTDSCMNVSQSQRYLAEIDASMVVELYRQKNTSCDESGKEVIHEETTDTEFETAKNILTTLSRT